MEVYSADEDEEILDRLRDYMRKKSQVHYKTHEEINCFLMSDFRASQKFVGAIAGRNDCISH